MKKQRKKSRTKEQSQHAQYISGFHLPSRKGIYSSNCTCVLEKARKKLCKSHVIYPYVFIHLQWERYLCHFGQPINRKPICHKFVTGRAGITRTSNYTGTMYKL